MKKPGGLSPPPGQLAHMPSSGYSLERRLGFGLGFVHHYLFGLVQHHARAFHLELAWLVEHLHLDVIALIEAQLAPVAAGDRDEGLGPHLEGVGGFPARSATGRHVIDEGEPAGFQQCLVECLLIEGLATISEGKVTRLFHDFGSGLALEALSQLEQFVAFETLGSHRGS